ncbi:hypothetical protein [Hipposideros bat coronavirus]|nr:hypothetical protein [Hipposideros bat coronavirus]
MQLFKQIKNSWFALSVEQRVTLVLVSLSCTAMIMATMTMSEGYMDNSRYPKHSRHEVVYEITNSTTRTTSVQLYTRIGTCCNYFAVWPTHTTCRLPLVHNQYDNTIRCVRKVPTPGTFFHMNVCPDVLITRKSLRKCTNFNLNLA